MLQLRPIADLVVREAPGHVAAASGLVACGDSLVVAIDDELALGVFGPDGTDGRLLPLEQGPLPSEPARRKAAKPDVESVAQLPDGSLLALGSGSTRRRDRGWIVSELVASRRPPGPVDLTALYAELRAQVAELNIEGAAVADGSLWLAQRGNGPAGVNALVELDLAGVRAALAAGEPLPAESIASIVEYELGDIEGVALAFSDLAEHEGRLLFCAVAEDARSTYDDGACLGAAIGRLDPRAGRVDARATAPGAPKLEGLAVDPGGRLLAVADADDRSRPAQLLTVTARPIAPGA